jgi:hypothetical protein
MDYWNYNLDGEGGKGRDRMKIALVAPGVPAPRGHALDASQHRESPNSLSAGSTSFSSRSRRPPHGGGVRGVLNPVALIR